MSTEGHTAHTPSRETLSDPAYPRYGALLVAAWLAGIILNLLTLSGFYDVALRDFGLLVAAVALARLAAKYAPVSTEKKK
ncbi:hypothetical protein ACWEOO_33970 [Kribbella sp. NPDC004138]